METRNAKLSEKSQAFRYAQNYLGEINQVIKEKENSQTIELFPALHADFCYAIVQDNDTLLKYLPYVMTAFYWNSQTIKFPRLLEEIEKYNPKTDDDSVPTKSEKVNRKTVVDNLPTKIRKDINTLFTLSGVTHRNDGINYQKTKPVLRHEDAGFQAIYREVLETHLINRYYKEQKLLGLLLGLGYSQETVENLHATIKSVMRSKKSETEKAEKIVAELITQIPLEFFRKIQKLEINPVTLECLRSIREEVLDAFILSDKTKEKSQSSSISQRIESKVYRQSFTPFYSEGLSYYEGSSPVEQKLYFKHLYLAMLYSVFTLACFQDSKLQDKIDYTASYALFQEHTLSFHLHLDQDARFSLHDIKKSFYTKQLKNDTFLSYFSDNYIKNDTFKDTLSFLSESVEALECSNALRIMVPLSRPLPQNLS
ncbi:hypothetical protein RFF05_04740 [Bengtsoniella intestinalis]|uniref:hypothetical protein n=1 Tax=Bengtsoniella intestinalis TaxID=3073143 RepID=UPI00391F194A